MTHTSSIQGTIHARRTKGKTIATTLLLAGTLSIAQAEQSSWFLGAQVGYGIQSAISIYDKMNNITMSDSANNLGFGVVVGYKHLLHEQFLLRYYLNVDAYNMRFQNLGAYNANSMMTFALNLDAMFHFYTSDFFHAGIFSGVQLGVNGFGGKLFDTQKNMYDNITQNGVNYEASNTNVTLDANLNVGIHFGTAAHGFDLYATIPFMRHTLTELKLQQQINGALETQYRSTLRLPYILGLRYTYSFSH